MCIASTLVAIGKPFSEKRMALGVSLLAPRVSSAIVEVSRPSSHTMQEYGMYCAATDSRHAAKVMTTPVDQSS